MEAQTEFKCDQCSAAFNDEGSLAEHKRMIHTGTESNPRVAPKTEETPVQQPSLTTQHQ